MFLTPDNISSLTKKTTIQFFFGEQVNLQMDAQKAKKTDAKNSEVKASKEESVKQSKEERVKSKKEVRITDNEEEQSKKEEPQSKKRGSEEENFKVTLKKQKAASEEESSDTEDEKPKEDKPYRSKERIPRTVTALILDPGRVLQTRLIKRATLETLATIVRQDWFPQSGELQSAECVHPKTQNVIGMLYWSSSHRDVPSNRTARKWQADEELRIRGRCVIVFYPKQANAKEIIGEIRKEHCKHLPRCLAEKEPDSEPRTPSTNAYVEFRKRNKEEFPDRKWKSLTDAEKQTYKERAQQFVKKE